MIANWYIWNDNEDGAYTTGLTVSVGTQLTGEINYNGMGGDGSYYYISKFINAATNTAYSNPMNVTYGSSYNNIYAPPASITLPVIPAQVWVYEVLEVYNVGTGDYPCSQPDVKMTGITLNNGSGDESTVGWTTGSNPGIAGYGEYTSVVSQSGSGSGEVDIHFNGAPTITYNYSTVNFINGTVSTTLSPTVEGTVTSWAISPSLPAGVTFNSMNGQISGPTSGSSAIGTPTNYTITATNSYGSGTYVMNIAESEALTFDISSGNSSITDFDIEVNGVNESGPRGVSQSNPIQVAGYCNSTNSTVVMQVTFGHIPTSATLYAPSSAPNNGVISGSNVTFTGVNMSSGGTTWIVIE